MECVKKKYKTGVNLKAVTRTAALKSAQKPVLYRRRARTDLDKRQACLYISECTARFKTKLLYHHNKYRVTKILFIFDFK